MTSKSNGNSPENGKDHTIADPQNKHSKANGASNDQVATASATATASADANGEERISITAESWLNAKTPSGGTGCASTSAPAATDAAGSGGGGGHMSLTDFHQSWSNSWAGDALGASMTAFAGAQQSSSMAQRSSLTTDQFATKAAKTTATAAVPSQSSAIHDAARITDWGTVRSLCETNPEAAEYAGQDGWTALHHACNRRCPQPDVVKALISAYPSALLEEENKGWTPLHYATRFKCSKEVVRLLVHLFPDKGHAAVSKSDLQGRTPLFYAVRYDAPPGVVEILLEADASAVLAEDQNADSALAIVWDTWAEKIDGTRNLQMIFPSEEEVASLSQQQQAQKVWDRLRSNDEVFKRWNRVEFFLKAAFGFNVNEGAYGDGEHESRCSTEKVNGKRNGKSNGSGSGNQNGNGNGCEDVHMDANVGECQDAATNGTAIAKANGKDRKWRMLHATAAIRCHVSLFLLACALHPEQAMEIDDDDLQCPKHIMAGVDEAAQLTALHLAASSRAVDESSRLVITKLLQLNPEAAQATASDGSLPLHRAVQNRNRAFWIQDGTDKIYAANPAAARTPDSNGLLPLHRACYSIAHHAELVEGDSRDGEADSIVGNLLVEHPRGPSHADSFGRYPLHIVAGHGTSWTPIVEQLCQSNPRAAQSRTSGHFDNQLPLHLVASNRNAKKQFIIKILEQHPRGSQQADKNGRLPLHLSCELGMSWDNAVVHIHNAFQGAIQRREENGRGWTALHMAASCSDSDETLLVNLVKLHPANASVSDANGRFPLHIACQTGVISWENGVSAIFDANPSALTSPDTCDMLPFHIVAFKSPSIVRSSSMPVDRPSAFKKQHRRISRSVSAEAEEEIKRCKKEAKIVSLLYHLLKVNPTILPKV